MREHAVRILVVDDEERRLQKLSIKNQRGVNHDIFRPLFWTHSFDDGF